MQTTLNFPMSLAEKYRPHTIDSFIGLEKPKQIMRKLAANPFPSAWLFVGPSGTGNCQDAIARNRALQTLSNVEYDLIAAYAKGIFADQSA